MKIVAFYLPQFHEIEENNAWWGKGFTEWTNVKNAKSFYLNHNQPTKPLHGYYNLLDNKTVEWQANLAKTYGVYGFCYYHYWFEGRMILEKPAENFLKNKTIDNKLCFCWANHSWRKTWNGTMEMLIEQGYGDEEEWERHFEYLNDFFQDDRYIKIDNKPVFMIFKPEEIPSLDERIKYYDEKCRQQGFDGIYIIESLNSQGSVPASSSSNGVVLREPSISLVDNSFIYKISAKLKLIQKLLSSNKIDIYNYDKVINKSIKVASKFTSDKTVFLGSFAGWDSTPRHGKNGYVIDGYNKNSFKNYLHKQKKMIEEKKVGDIVFLNAWNEWAEGMYLEPDTKLKYDKLEAIDEVTNNSPLKRKTD